MTRLFAAACAIMAISSGVREYQHHEADKARVAAQAVVEDRSSFADCGGYTVVVTAHNTLSARDAEKVAFSYFDQCREVGNGTHHTNF